MFCRQCGRPNPEGTKFCGDCGAAMADAPTIALVATGRIFGGAVLAARLPACSHCGSAAPPIGYFSRPLNIAKLVIATWFYVFPAVLFYLARKERLVCGGCGRWRGSVGALEASQAAWMGQGQLGPSGGEAALMLPPRDEAAELALRQAVRKKRSAVFWGITSTAFMALGVGSGLGFLAGAAACGFWALFQLSRASKLQAAGDAGRKRHEALRILQLAKAHGGRLSVTDVAASLAMDLGEAERALDAMLDGSHVDVDVDDQGRVRYVFTELLAPVRP